MQRWAFINNSFVKDEEARIHVRDLAVQRGYGVFDFFRLVNFDPLFLNDHLDRFYASASYMRLHLTYSKEELSSIINECILKNNLPSTGYRLTLTGGISELTMQPEHPLLVITQHNFQPPTTEQIENGVRLLSYQHRRQFPSVKTIDYLLPVWLQPEVQQKNAFDILYHDGDMISECPRSNFFIINQHNKIITPSTGILKGITRNRLIELLSNEYAIEERILSMEEARIAKAAFITSTTKIILPVRQLDDVIFCDEGVKIVQSLRQRFCRHYHC